MICHQHRKCHQHRFGDLSKELKFLFREKLKHNDNPKISIIPTRISTEKIPSTNNISYWSWPLCSEKANVTKIKFTESPSFRVGIFSVIKQGIWYWVPRARSTRTDRSYSLFKRTRYRPVIDRKYIQVRDFLRAKLEKVKSCFKTSFQGQNYD